MTTKVPYALLTTDKFADVASAATVNLNTPLGAYGQITGTTNITAITLAEGKLAWVRFTGVLTLTHGASLVLPSAASITTAAGDWALFANVSGVVYCLYYTKASGKQVAAIAAGDVALIANSALPAGTVVQVVNTQTGAVASGTTVVPADDTIPQNTEGDEYMTLAITPQSATNKLKIEVVINMCSSAATNTMVGMLFKDSVADALAAIWHTAVTGNPVALKFTHYMTAGAATAMTFKVRGGGTSAGTTTFNGVAAARFFGGVMASSITITEIKV